MKTYVITLSKTFPKGHPRVGELTFFASSLRNAIEGKDEELVILSDTAVINGKEYSAGDVIRVCTSKLHTIRGNYYLWANRIAEVRRGEACLSVRQWADKPYRSKQVEIARLTKDDGVGIQKLSFEKIMNEIFCMADNIDCVPKVSLANNDGLSLNDWLYWFKGYNYKEPMAIIHFTKFRY